MHIVSLIASAALASPPVSSHFQPLFELGATFEYDQRLEVDPHAPDGGSVTDTSSFKCVVARVGQVGAARTSLVTCKGGLEDEKFTPAGVWIATRAGIWRAEDLPANPAALKEATSGQPLLAASPKKSKKTRADEEEQCKITVAQKSVKVGKAKVKAWCRTVSCQASMGYDTLEHFCFASGYGMVAASDISDGPRETQLALTAITGPAVVSGGLDYGKLAALKGTRAMLIGEAPGKPIKIGDRSWPEGTVVTLKDRGGGIGGGRADAEIVIGGKTVFVPAVQVVDEESVSVNADGTAAVFATIFECGDYCYSKIVLLRPDGSRSIVSPQAGPFPIIEWGPGGTFAVGSRGLYLGKVTGKIKVHEGFTAPAFDKKGRLWVRGNADDDAVYLWRGSKAPKKFLSIPGNHPESESEADMGDPSVVTFKKGKLHAVFQRGEKRVQKTKRLPK